MQTFDTRLLFMFYILDDVSVFSRLRLSQQETELVSCEITIITRQTDNSLLTPLYKCWTLTRIMPESGLYPDLQTIGSEPVTIEDLLRP